MPEPLTSAALSPVFCRGAVGFYGKLPARGDFVRFGLPHGYIDRWDAWFERVLTESRVELGEKWLPAWLEAPIWRFALSPGTCGPGAVLGLWMPSVDRVGRYFPLTLAVVAHEGDAIDLIRDGGGFLAAAEQVGLAAVTEELDPKDLGPSLAAAAGAPPVYGGVEPERYPLFGALWWTAGAPRAPAGAFASDGLPDGATFSRMIDARRDALIADGCEAGL